MGEEEEPRRHAEPADAELVPRDGRPHFAVGRARRVPGEHPAHDVRASLMELRGGRADREVRLGVLGGAAGVDTGEGTAYARGALVSGGLGIGPEGRRNVDIDMAAGSGFAGRERRDGVTRHGAEANVTELNARFGGQVPGLGYTALGGNLRVGVGGAVERACIPQPGGPPIVGAGIEAELGVGAGLNFRSELLGRAAQRSWMLRRFFGCSEAERLPEEPAHDEPEAEAPAPAYDPSTRRRGTLVPGLVRSGAIVPGGH